MVSPRLPRVRLTPLVLDRLAAVLDRWIARRATPTREALAAVAGLAPAVVVTGGSAGIGRAIAGLFARAGNPVLIVARDPARLAEARAHILAAAEAGRAPAAAAVHTLALDITALDAAARIDAALAEVGGYLDVLVNSAAVGLSGPVTAQTTADLDRLVSTNVTALTALTRHAVVAMQDRGRGGVINLASLGGFVPGPNQAAYYASKAYVCAFTIALAEELAGRGVRVTVVAPGPVETGFHARMGAEAALYRRLLPAMSPERVARAAMTGFALGRRVVVPGVLPRGLAVAVALLPQRLTVPIVAWLLWRPPDGR